MPRDEDSELTIRAVLIGAAIGVLLCAGNVYVGLKVGVWDSGMIVASILAFAVVRSARENAAAMTTASSMATMPATAGVLGAIPGLALLGHDYAAWAIAAWGIALGVIGVWVALALRNQLLDNQKLPFPSGIAAAEVIGAMHAKGGTRGRARALAIAGAIAGAWTWFRDGTPKLLPGVTALPGGLGFQWSPLMLGVGALIGLRVALAIALGAAVAWIALAPHLSIAGDYDALAAWLVWPALGLMLGDAAVAIAGQARQFVRAGRDFGQIGRGGALLAGGAAIAVVALGWLVFDLHPLVTIGVLALSVFLAAVCARVAGQTDVALLGQMGNLTQLAHGVLGGSSAAANVAAASVPSGDAAQTCQTLWALRAGAVLGATPAKQVRAQLVGVALGAAITAVAYALLVRAQPIGSDALPAPSARTFQALGEALTKGTGGLPAHALFAGAIALAAGIVLALGSRFGLERYLPSPAAIGIGFILPAASSATILAGAAIFTVAQRVWREPTEHYGQAIAGGALAGESFVGVVIAALYATGVLK